MAEVDGDAIARWAAEALRAGGHRPGTLRWTLLPADAGTRTYVRLHDGAGRRWLAMLLADRDTDYLAVDGEDPNDLAFGSLGRFLEARGWPVPRIFHQDVHRDWLVIEDFGDVRLQEAAETCSRARRRSLYRRAARLLVSLQAHTAEAHARRVIAVRRRMDEATLTWEFLHYLEWGIEARGRQSVTPAERALLKGEFTRLSREIAAWEPVLAHRDYHARNLMVHRRGIRVVDFQDAVLAGPAYDLASLLLDAYVDLHPRFVGARVDEFHAELCAAGMRAGSLDEFRRLFDVQGIQRCLKVGGRFVWLAHNRGQVARLADVGRVLRHVPGLLARHDDLADLRSCLERHGWA